MIREFVCGLPGSHERIRRPGAGALDFAAVGPVGGVLFKDFVPFWAIFLAYQERCLPFEIWLAGADFAGWSGFSGYRLKFAGKLSYIGVEFSAALYLGRRRFSAQVVATR